MQNIPVNPICFVCTPLELHKLCFMKKKEIFLSFYMNKFDRSSFRADEGG